MDNAGLLRRLGAVLYDALLLLGLGVLATVPFVVVHGDEMRAEDPLHQLTLLAVAYAFFVGFWCRTGSTLGMLAWGLRVEADDRRLPTVTQATVRFAVAIASWLVAGLGFLWQLWDRDKLTWHDRLSGTRLRYYPKQR
jgi:uncharacterized RDD family membrane protein YckC